MLEPFSLPDPVCNCINYSLLYNGGPLPSFLTFDSTTLTLSTFTIDFSDIGTYNLELIGVLQTNT